MLVKSIINKIAEVCFMSWENIVRFSILIAIMCCSLLSYADIVWIDVRTAVEHNVDNIDGDVRISHGQIVKGVYQLYPDKETEIRLYCRSGRRAGKAVAALKEAGYKNVANIGSIEDARKERSLNE